LNIVLNNTDYEKKVIVLKKNIDDGDAREIIEKKKTSVFRSLLKKPKTEEVHLHSLKLNLEAITMISGNYAADYFRKAIHQIKVDYTVKEVVLGEGIFPIRTKTKFQKTLSSKKGEQKISKSLITARRITSANKKDLETLAKLGELKKAGIITDKEFQTKKKQILKRI